MGRVRMVESLPLADRCLPVCLARHWHGGALGPRNGSVPAGGVSLRATGSAADGTRIAWAKRVVPAVCWWGRQIVEPTDTSHSTCVAASALTCNLFTMRAEAPSMGPPWNQAMPGRTGRASSFPVVPGLLCLLLVVVCLGMARAGWFGGRGSGLCGHCGHLLANAGASRVSSRRRKVAEANLWVTVRALSSLAAVSAQPATSRGQA